MKPFFSCCGWIRDPLFYLLLMLGLTAWFLPDPGFTPALWWLAAMAFVEELIFRGLIQEGIHRLLRYRFRIGPITLANLAASVLFAGTHLLTQPTGWALATFFPSLVFGFVWDRHRSVTGCFVIHLFYNICFFYKGWV
ncbi:JDVT-CTERM system glutamic-type intramembrane protease [Desulfonatronospira sp.]|uniref:JDVT-CTERM system glutamic-type intramembrane protease MrtJ n=1 Tax=Desulfonatronospira sp. TaxID=1962951 RepID=UPI0025BC9284|nr:JDVT-CTERM system glutamic-type intramembrane protease [Desulfonatronospira sp.]